LRASTGARGTLRSKWSPKKEKSKLVSRRRKMPEMMRREEIYPEATASASSGEARQSYASSLSELV
jgi:hypothetical protein